MGCRLGQIFSFANSIFLTWLSCCCMEGCCFSLQDQKGPNPHFVGFDLGTSGARISVIEQNRRWIDKSETNNNGKPSLIFKEVFTKSISWNEAKSNKGSFDDPDAWMDAVDHLLLAALQNLGAGTRRSVKSMCISGTSASCCLIDSNSNAVTRHPRMYNYHVITSSSTSNRNANADDNDGNNNNLPGQRALGLLDRWAPPRHTARSATGSLAKLLTWNYEQPLAANEVLCHQSDYVRIQLCHDTMIANKIDSTTSASKTPLEDSQVAGADRRSTGDCYSDWHNCLKLGYDVRQLQWPAWLVACLEDAGISNPLTRRCVVPSQVVSPGQPLARLRPDVAARYGLSPDTVMVAGTTDSNAAFLAAALGEEGFGDSSSNLVGTAVTSLGSTLALKLLSEAYVEDADRGVYSHRFPQVANDFNNANDRGLWLVGGASNVGCAVLRQQGFDNDELDRLSALIDSSTNSPLSYYPLAINRGERFPVADGNKEPCLEPIPEQRRDYLHGILQGISDVERDGYRILGELGAVPSQPRVIWTCGGGSRNDMWSAMRERRLNESYEGVLESIKVKKARHVEASYGAALLAASSFCTPALM